MTIEKQVEVYAEPPRGNRWKVGTIGDEAILDENWIRRNTGIAIDNVKSWNWSSVINAWIIKLRSA